MRKVEEYEVFKRAHLLVLRIYDLTKNFPKEEIFNLTSQIRRSAYSIPMNLVEGGAKISEKEFSYHIVRALGSCEELRYQILLAKDLNYISKDNFEEIEKECEDIKKMLTKLNQKILS